MVDGRTDHRGKLKFISKQRNNNTRNGNGNGPDAQCPEQNNIFDFKQFEKQ